ncbi:MAG: O-antigen ligase family protein [Silvanigrellales bacterium]|jgi:hypothetical protein|nr:O-antigen ligase family protein [Silvanigrellales bacterium]
MRETVASATSLWRIALSYETGLLTALLLLASFLPSAAIPAIALGVATLFAALAFFHQGAVSLALHFVGFYPLSLTLGRWISKPFAVGLVAYLIFVMGAASALFSRPRAWPEGRLEWVLVVFAGVLTALCALTGYSAPDTTFFTRALARMAMIIGPGLVIVAALRTPEQFAFLMKTSFSMLTAFLLYFLVRLGLSFFEALSLPFSPGEVDNVIGLSVVTFTHFALCVSFLLGTFAGSAKALNKGFAASSADRVLLGFFLLADVVLILWLTQRGALFGLVASVVCLPLFFRPQGGWRQSALARGSFVGGIAAVVVALLWLGATGSFASTLSKLQTLKTFFSLLVAGEASLETVGMQTGEMPLGTISTRVDGYVTAWREILNHPWTGIGFTHFQSVKANYPHGYPHNIELDFLVTFGLLGLALLGVVIFLVFKGLQAARHQSFRLGVARPETCFAVMMVVFFSVVLQVSGALQSLFPNLLVCLFLLIRATRSDDATRPNSRGEDA